MHRRRTAAGHQRRLRIRRNHLSVGNQICVPSLSIVRFRLLYDAPPLLALVLLC
jgi:hypothetical protein